MSMSLAKAREMGSVVVMAKVYGGGACSRDEYVRYRRVGCVTKKGRTV